MWYKLLIGCFLVSGLSGCAGWDKIQYKNGKARGREYRARIAIGADLNAYEIGLVEGLTSGLIPGGYDFRERYVEQFKE